MGLLLLFLETPCPGDEQAHREVLSVAPHADRVEARSRAIAAGRFAPLFDAERGIGSRDIDGEPLGIPGP
jgi:hypothetical protein